MKNIKYQISNIIRKTLLVAAGLVATLTEPAIQAQPVPPLRAWAGNGNVVSNTLVTSDILSWAVASPNSQQPGPAILDYLNVQTDKTNSVVQFYAPTNLVPIGTTNSGLTNIVLNNTNTQTSAILVSNTVVLIRHLATDTWERNRIFSNGPPAAGPGASTNAFSLMYPLITPTTNGDQMFLMNATGKIPLSATFSAATPGFSKELNTPGIYSGIQGQPLLFEIQYGTNGNINAYSGHYLP